MAWTIERDGAPASRITLPVLRGDVTVTQQQADSTSVSLDGTVTVWSGPPSPPTPSLPPLHFTSATELTRLRNLVQSRVVCRITDTDTGTTYRVRPVGAWAATQVAQARTATRPRWQVTLTVVGV